MSEKAHEGGVAAHIDRHACIGSGTCEALLPAVFSVQHDGVAVSLPVEELTRLVLSDSSLIAVLREAAAACPTHAIRIDRHDVEQH